MLPFIRWIAMYCKLNPAERSLTLKARPTTRPDSISFPVSRILQLQIVLSMLYTIHHIYFRDVVPYGLIASIGLAILAILKLPKRA